MNHAPRSAFQRDCVSPKLMQTYFARELLMENLKRSELQKILESMTRLNRGFLALDRLKINHEILSI